MGAHACQALVIMCMDFRIQPEIRKFLIDKGLLGRCDIVSYAGAAKNIAGAEPNGLLSQVVLAHKLHSIKEVWLINHTDCSAYGGRKNFSSAHDEEQVHLEDLRKAAGNVRSAFPEIDHAYIPCSHRT